MQKRNLSTTLKLFKDEYFKAIGDAVQLNISDDTKIDGLIVDFNDCCKTLKYLDKIKSKNKEDIVYSKYQLKKDIVALATVEEERINSITVDYYVSPRILELIEEYNWLQKHDNCCYRCDGDGFIQFNEGNGEHSSAACPSCKGSKTSDYNDNLCIDLNICKSNAIEYVKNEFKNSIFNNINARLTQIEIDNSSD